MISDGVSPQIIKGKPDWTYHAHIDLTIKYGRNCNVKFIEKIALGLTKI